MANAPKNAAAPAVNMGKGPAGEDLPDFDKWDDIQIGFAPYWNAEAGAWCFAEVIAKDERNPEFVRYLMLAHTDTKCSRGPKDPETHKAEEDVVVKKGECFSVSLFYSLSRELDYQLYLRTKGHNVPVRVEAKKQTKTSTAGRTVWQWSVKNDPVHTPILNQYRGEYAALAGEGTAARPQLEA